MPPIRQSSFAGGELAPELQGRTSLNRYASALRRCRNFIPSRSGAAVSRPGTDYQGALKFPNTTVRLVPFLYSSGAVVTPYLLELGDLYLRTWEVYGNYSGYTGADVATPWSASQLDKLGWAQEGNTLTVTHPSHPPQEVKFDGTTWTVTPLSFDRPVISGSIRYDGGGHGAPDTDHPAKEWSWVATQLERDLDGNVLESAPKAVDLSDLFHPWSSTSTYNTGDFVTYNGGWYVSTTNTNIGNTPSAYSLDQPNAHWSPVDPATPPLPVYPDMPITFHSFASAPVMGGTVFGWRFYRGVKGGPLGWIGDTGQPWGSTLATAFTDLGDDPDYSTAPPQGFNPFLRNGSAENPAGVTYYQGRRILGGTATRPHTLFASAVADLSNFDKAIVPRKDDALVFALASGRGEQIRSFVSKSAVLALTSSSVWAISGGDGPLTFDSVQAVPQSEIGASWLPGIPVGRALLYVRDGGTGVRSLAYSWERQGYVDLDLSLIASHLLRSDTVRDWDYAAQPWSVVWMVRSDGKLLSLTLARDEQEQEEGVAPENPTGGGVRYAWAWHDTQGTVEAVCVVRVDGQDIVHLAVARTVNGSTVRYLERFVDRMFPVDASGNVVVEDAYALDCAKSTTFAPNPASATVAGLAHLEGLQVYAVADGNVVGPLTVSGGQVTLPQAVNQVHVGLAFTPEIELLDPVLQGAEVRTRQKTLSEITFEVVDSRGLAVGSDADHLTDWRQRTVADSYGAVPYATDIYRVKVAGGWSKHARAFLRQTQPLPVTIAAVTRDITFGG